MNKEVIELLLNSQAGGEAHIKGRAYFIVDAEAFSQALAILRQPSEINELREQLIKLCRVFHAEDCICKWCNIVKERAEKGKMGFTPAEQTKKPFNADDYPLKPDSAFRAKY